MPVGGENTHCVMSAHRGLPSAKLFTDLDRVERGDTFQVVVLDQVLTYQVDFIKVIEPTDASDLQIIEGGDYCTLFTCTPYGINTHRLLVRGVRIETLKEKPVLYVFNKCDIAEKQEDFTRPVLEGAEVRDVFFISAKTGRGIDKLLSRIDELVPETTYR